MISTISNYMDYEKYVYDDKLISPINGYECKRITKQNIKQFGLNSMNDFHLQYRSFKLTKI